MIRILLALAILTAATGGFLAAHNLTNQLTRELNAHRDAWLAQTQQLAAVQSEQTDLAERMRQLKASLAQSQPAAENELWSALRTNRADRLPPELRERVLEELGFTWQFSPDFIVVTKKALRDTRGNVYDRALSRGWVFNGGKLSEVAFRILALTPEQRGQLEAVMQGVQTDLNDWALAHVERREPKNNVVADYVLPGNRALWLSVTNNLALAVGPERADLILDISSVQMAADIGVSPDQRSMRIFRELVGNEQRLSAMIETERLIIRLGYLPEVPFPAAFTPIFTNGWADVAKREGFEMPKESQEK